MDTSISSIAPSPGSFAHPPPGRAAPEAPEDVQDPAWMAAAYFVLYFAYLFLTLENEALHWVTLVLIPVGLVSYYAGPGKRLRRTLASFGLRRGSLTTGLGLTLGLGVAVSFFQIGFSRMGADIVALLTSSRAAIALPFTLLFLLVFTATTEEVFFRGYLQTRLERLTGSKWWGLVLASVAFGFYHLPYAYLNPNWPSSGDWSEALVASLGQGIIGGLVLGGLFLYSRRNLVAPLLLHALINLLPAATMLKFGGS